MFPSIRAQLTAWLALLVTLCLAAFAVYLYVAVGQLLTADLDQTLRIQAHQKHRPWPWRSCCTRRPKETERRYYLIIAAAEKANIHDVILNLPDGYDTVVREQGNKFSAGQRQCLSIARTMLRDTPILILDEPTANLDVEAEAEVMHALQTLIVGRTVLTISHRLNTLGQVDEIIVSCTRGALPNTPLLRSGKP